MSGWAPEAIAHTPAIAYLNATVRSGSVGGVTPDVQWETNLPRTFPDALNDDRLFERSRSTQVFGLQLSCP